jgi:hypothetical protein
MKKMIYIFIVLNLAIIFSGCEYMVAPSNYYVSIYNNENDKYISAVYFRDFYYSGERWSKNTVCSYIYPYEYFDVMLEEGTYDFKVIMEDDYYIYEINIYEVYVYNNVNLDICYDCYDKKDNVKIIKTQKEKKKIE